jgi:hypothetical protein
MVRHAFYLFNPQLVIITLAPLEAASILQAKRIDIKKMSTMALGSLKCQASNEDELLDSTSLLARKLVQSQK